MESGKTTTALVWAGVLVAGAIALVAVAKRPRRSLHELTRAPLRDVQDVLADCYNKIHEIEENIPNFVPNRTARRVNSLNLGNNKPVYES